MSNASLQSACLAVGLVAAWAPVAESQADVQTNVHVNLNLEPDGVLTHARLMVCNTSAPGWRSFTAASLPSIGSGMFTSDMAFDPAHTAFAIVGIYHGSGDPIAPMVSFAHLTILNSSFESLFPGTAEPVFQDMLLGDDPAVDAFLVQHFNAIAQRAGAPAEVYHFTNATFIGSITVTIEPVPAPGTSGALGLPALLLARRRRRASTPRTPAPA